MGQIIQILNTEVSEKKYSLSDWLRHLKKKLKIMTIKYIGMLFL